MTVNERFARINATYEFPWHCPKKHCLSMMKVEYFEESDQFGMSCTRCETVLILREWLKL